MYTKLIYYKHTIHGKGVAVYNQPPTFVPIKLTSAIDRESLFSIPCLVDLHRLVSRHLLFGRTDDLHF